MHTVTVNLGPRSYCITFSGETADGIGSAIRTARPRSTLALMVTDTNTHRLGQAIATELNSFGFHTGGVTVAAGEGSKSAAVLSSIYDALYELAADRSTVVVAVGGGVVGDLAGFAAATYNRGLPLMMVPTTLLAMVDSSVGGKTGINHPRGKNLIGAFHQPAGVWIDPAYLDSLPEREYLSGLAEIVKYGVILDAELFTTLEANSAAIRSRDHKHLVPIIARCCQLKASVVEQDEREETGLRAILNYGHTFAHAFETIGGYGCWLHGEAVAAGMICASRLAEKLERIDDTLTQRQVRLLEAFSLPVAPRPEWPIEELIAVMRRDKKAVAGKLRFILPTRLGEARLVGDIPESLARDVLEGR